MPTLPLEPRHDRARPADPHAVAPAAPGSVATPGSVAPSAEPSAAERRTLVPGPVDAAGGSPEPVPTGAAPTEAAPTEAERARWRDRRTGLIALIVVTIALWAVIAAAVGFATTM